MNSFIPNAIVIRYDEIGLKGGNRQQFERQLQLNLRHLLTPFIDNQSLSPIKFHLIRGRIWMNRCDKKSFTPEELQIIHSVWKKGFGLSSYSPVVMISPNYEDLLNISIQFISERLRTVLKDRSSPLSFRIRVRRPNKKFPLKSRDFEIKIIDSLPQEFHNSKIKIDLQHAELTAGIEIREEFAFFYFDSFDGPGGLPVGSNDPVLTLLSGGIDSPVAALKIMKRGSHSDFITFDSSPYTPPESVDKVKRLTFLLNQWQRHSKLYICNLSELQKLIRDCCNPRYRTVLYRRMMMRIASIIAQKYRYGALITGEAVGQVASQTICNLNTINQAADYVVLRPLSGTDKQETIRWAEEFGTFEISKEQVPDSCTVFAPDSPATQASLAVIEKEEKKLGDWQLLLIQTVEKIEIWFPE